jgi:GNAT superfamily N-acetyltransferase
MTSDATIQEMTLNDLDEVLCMESHGSLVPWSETCLSARSLTPGPLFHDERQDLPEGLVSFICFGPSKMNLNFSISRSSDYRRMGFALEMMTFYIDLCRTMNIRRLFLEVGCANEAAVRLYESFSYEPVGKRSKFYQGRFDALIMRRDLEA